MQVAKVMNNRALTVATTAVTVLILAVVPMGWAQSYPCTVYPMNIYSGTEQAVCGYVYNGGSVPAACPVNTYNPWSMPRNLITYTCRTCPPGWHTGGKTGQPACQPCKPGFYYGSILSGCQSLATGYYSNPGYFDASTGVNTIAPTQYRCPAGQFDVFNLFCQNCGPGQQRRDTRDYCEDVPSGSIMRYASDDIRNGIMYSSTTNWLDYSTQCSAGRYSRETSKGIVCLACPTGKCVSSRKRVKSRDSSTKPNPKSWRFRFCNANG